MLEKPWTTAPNSRKFSLSIPLSELIQSMDIHFSCPPLLMQRLTYSIFRQALRKPQLCVILLCGLLLWNIKINTMEENYRHSSQHQNKESEVNYKHSLHRKSTYFCVTKSLEYGCVELESKFLTEVWNYIIINISEIFNWQSWTQVLP